MTVSKTNFFKKTANLKEFYSDINDAEAEADALKSYQLRRFFLEERKNIQKQNLEKYKKEKNLISSDAGSAQPKDEWIAIMNYKKEINEIENNQQALQHNNNKRINQQAYEEQSIENAVKRINKKLDEIEYNENMMKDIENYKQEQDYKLKEFEEKKMQENKIRKKQIKEKKILRRINILQNLKLDMELSIIIITLLSITILI